MNCFSRVDRTRGLIKRFFFQTKEKWYETCHTEKDEGHDRIGQQNYTKLKNIQRNKPNKIIKIHYNFSTQKGKKRNLKKKSLFSVSTKCTCIITTLTISSPRHNEILLRELFPYKQASNNILHMRTSSSHSHQNEYIVFPNVSVAVCFATFFCTYVSSLFSLFIIGHEKKGELAVKGTLRARQFRINI